MNLEKISSIVFGLTLIADGIYTSYTSMSSKFLAIWGLYSKYNTPEQYIFGGILILFGSYIIYMNIRYKR